jgi:hypothetical protein
MTPPVPAPASTAADSTPPPEAALLERLVAAGDALTDALVRHDLDALVAATREAEAQLSGLAAHAEAPPPDAAMLRLGDRIGATARRNALLLEQAWTTDAALLRLLATAARAELDAAAGTGYAHVAAAAAARPVGWLDRSA